MHNFKYVYVVWAHNAYIHTVLQHTAHIGLAQEAAYKNSSPHYIAHIFRTQDAHSSYADVHHSGY